MSASAAPAPAAPRQPAVRYANFTAASADDLDLMSEIWLLDVCAAPWVSREAQKLAAFIATMLNSGRTNEVFLRDIESLLNIQPEETNRGLKLLKTFRAVEDFNIEKGRLTLSVRVGKLQRLHMLDAKAKLDALASAEADAATTRNVAQLREVVAEARLDAEPLAQAVNG